MQAAAGMKALLEEYEDTFIKVSEADDPKQQERILARQGRWRIEAELVRDTALSFAGLLSPAVGGPSAKPYQPFARCTVRRHAGGDVAPITIGGCGRCTGRGCAPGILAINIPQSRSAVHQSALFRFSLLIIRDVLQQRIVHNFEYDFGQRDIKNRPSAYPRPRDQQD